MNVTDKGLWTRSTHNGAVHKTSMLRACSNDPTLIDPHCRRIGAAAKKKAQLDSYRYLGYLSSQIWNHVAAFLHIQLLLIHFIDLLSTDANVHDVHVLAPVSGESQTRLGQVGCVYWGTCPVKQLFRICWCHCAQGMVLQCVVANPEPCLWLLSNLKLKSQAGLLQPMNLLSRTLVHVDNIEARRIIRARGSSQ